MMIFTNVIVVIGAVLVDSELMIDCIVRGES